MPDQPTGTPPDASKPDLSQYVPKSELEKTTDTYKKEVAALKSKLDESSLALLDPDYIAYKNTREAKPTPKAKELEGDNPYAERFERLEKMVETTTRALQDAESRRELQEVMVKFEDWGDYVDDVKTFYRSNQDSNASYEQVYRYVKSLRQDKEAKEKLGKDGKPKAPATEKPSGTSTPKPALEQKEYKTVTEANAATLSALQEKFPDLGHTI